jgi:hypothetical protein
MEAFSDMTRCIQHNIEFQEPPLKKAGVYPMPEVRKAIKLAVWMAEQYYTYEDKCFSNGTLFIQRFHENRAINVSDVDASILNRGCTDRCMQSRI